MERVQLTTAEKSALSKVNRKRVRLPPKWPGVFENYARNWVNRNYWRVRNVFDSKEDALAGCALTFARCLKYYAETVENDAWFMALYKRALVNDWNTFSAKDGKRRNIVSATFDTTSDHYAVSHNLIDQNCGPALVWVKQASSDIQAVLDVLAKADPELTQYIFEGEAFSVNRRLCNLAGIREFDALAAVHNLLSEGTRA